MKEPRMRKSAVSPGVVKMLADNAILRRNPQESFEQSFPQIQNATHSSCYLRETITTITGITKTNDVSLIPLRLTSSRKAIHPPKTKTTNRGEENPRRGFRLRPNVVRSQTDTQIEYCVRSPLPDTLRYKFRISACHLVGLSWQALQRLPCISTDTGSDYHCRADKDTSPQSKLHNWRYSTWQIVRDCSSYKCRGFTLKRWWELDENTEEMVGTAERNRKLTSKLFDRTST
jgi:hypothetical protein